MIIPIILGHVSSASQIRNGNCVRSRLLGRTRLAITRLSVKLLTSNGNGAEQDADDYNEDSVRCLSSNVRQKVAVAGEGAQDSCIRDGTDVISSNTSAQNSGDGGVEDLGVSI
jgi:hypothetical protein